MFREISKTKATADGLKELEVYNCDFLNVRQGYSTKYKILGQIPPDRVVEVHSTKNNWARIVYNGGYGWCSLSYLRGITETNYTSATKVYKVKEAINLRRTGDWNADILKIANKGMLLNVIDASGAWASVWYANKIMYAPTAYLEDTGQTTPGSGTVAPEPDDTIPALAEEKEPVRPKIFYKNDFWIDIYNPDIPNFRFNTSEFNVHMVEKPTEVINMLKYESVEAMSLDGDLINSYGTFDTTEISLEFFIRKENYKFIMKKLKEIVRMPSFRLTLGWDRRFFRNARISDNIEIEEYDFDEIEAKMTMTFELQPYKYAQEGVHWLKDTQGRDLIRHGSYIINNYEKSYPKFYIQIPHTSYCKANGEGKKQVSINLYNTETETSHSYKINAHSFTWQGKPIKYIYGILDSVTNNLYEDTTDANLNFLFERDCDFPVIEKGKILVSQSANYVNIVNNNFLPFKIIPNWREL